MIFNTKLEVSQSYVLVMSCTHSRGGYQPQPEVHFGTTCVNL